MSDANLGEKPPKRPGMSAGVHVSYEATAHGKRNNKRPNRRPKKRQFEDDNGTQANTDKNTLSGSGNALPKSGHGDDSADVHTSRQGEKSRRKRRRNRGRQSASGNARQRSGAQDVERSPHAGLNEETAPPLEKKAKSDRRPARDKGRNKKKSNKAFRDGGKHTQSRSTDTQRENHSTTTQKNHPAAYAALDLGTNNCRLLIAVPQQPGRFRVVDAFSRIVRLGEGLASSGRLSEAAMDRALEALKTCAHKLQARPIKGARLIATEACRRAENGAEFLRRVESEAGLNLEIVDRETEARLAVAGCASLVDRKAKGVVLFDIGGGSSELALLDMSKRKKFDFGPAMVSWTSLPHGVVTLSEKHGGGKLVTRSVFEDMVADVSELLEAYDGRDALAAAAEGGEVHLLGTSGTVTTLAGIHLKLPRYDRRRVDGTWMASKDVDAMIDALVDMSFEERVANPCIGQDRADLVLAGCAILVAIQRLWPCPRLRVADRGLREGLLTEMMNADNAWQKRSRHPRHRQGYKNRSNKSSGGKAHG